MNKPPIKTSGEWRNRNSRSEVVDPATLTANPLNARKHPPAQRAALKGLLKEIGWIGKVIVNERTMRIIDGHMRVEEAAAKGTTVPVDFVDLDDNEERMALALFDPIGALADTDQAALDELMASIETTDADVLALIDSLELKHPAPPVPPDDFDEKDDNIETDHQCPKCGYEWS